MNEQYRATISKVANNAVALTDSFGFTDHELNTALGKKDGRAYEHLWDAVQKNPVNHGEESEKLKVSTRTLAQRFIEINYFLFFF